MRSQAVPGWLALLLGWSVEATRVPWSANLFLCVGSAFLLWGCPRVALGQGVVGSLAGLTVFSLPDQPTGGDQIAVVALHWGRYFWLASLCSFVLLALYRCAASWFARYSHAEKGASEGKAIPEL